jgi:hypothetical protein
MQSTLIRATAAALLIAAAWWASANEPAPALRWYKGNLHAHTVNSDGDSTPAQVVQWYREHGYNFLVLSDHNYLTAIDALRQVYEARDRFALIPGEEVTSTHTGKEIHVNGYGLREEVSAQTGRGVVEILQKSIDAIRQAGGMASINHPNYTWAIGSRELRAVTGYQLFEVFNGSWSVGNRGGGGRESHEEMWDQVLTAGQLLYGIAVDDAHDFQTYGKALPYPPTIPGTGWVYVRAAKLTPDGILRALAQGDFYASTGAILDDVRHDANELALRIKQVRDNRYRTYFIGTGGRVLAVSDELNPVYRFRGNERYVRARVEESTGGNAWVQPVFVTQR